MNIEFHTPYNKVSEKLLTDIRSEILELTHIKKNISRAEVIMRADETINSPENKICEIRLTAYGANLIAHTRTADFSISAKEAIKELKRLVKQQVKRLKSAPDNSKGLVFEKLVRN